ncbi:hypothetical protein EAE96_008801 [Botrytis aclada]|nr:hypothetical protein EAE96_008801 [Botrytis aclada]
MAPTCYTCKITFQVNSHMMSHCQATGHIQGSVCSHCDKPFQDEEARRQHVQAKHPQGKRPFPCSRCTESFRTDDARKRHTEIKHPFQCSYCKDVFNSAEGLKQHNSSKHHFACEFDDCDSVFTTNQLLNNHKGNKHKFRCNKCSKDFQSQGPLDKHDTEFHRSFSCNSCNKEFKSEIALEQHINSSAHSQTCPKCGKPFPSYASLQQHTNAEHLWKCNQCQLTFDGRNHLVLHHTHEHLMVKCSICYARFNHTAELYKHKSEQHSFQCEHCPIQPFAIYTLLQEHEYSSHNFKCSVCPKHFKLQVERNSHFEQVHTHLCSQCRLRFDSLVLLNTHRLCHQVSCPSCQINFDDEAAYESHYRDAHQLKCPKCFKLFKDANDFFNHAITHTPVSEESTAAPKTNGPNGNTDCKYQLKCFQPGCLHQSSTLNAFRHHYHTCNMVRCDSCDGFFDQREDPQLQAHRAKMHSPRPIFGCVQCTQAFPTSDAAAAHYATEHAFICEACPGTYFINSATRERHLTTCGNLSETSDSGESFQTSRTKFSPLMQRRTLPPVIRVSPSSVVPLVQVHEEPLSPAQPLIQIYGKSAIERINAAQELARKILAEANARPQATVSCQNAPLFWEFKSSFDLRGLTGLQLFL